MKRNLLALSSAAVLAVYSAGYARTKEAAARFANETGRRRPPEPVPAPMTPPLAAKVATTKASPSKKASAKKALAPDTKAKISETPVAVVSAPGVKDSMPTPVAAPAPVIVAPPVDTTPKTTATTPDSAAKQAAKWKDGVYAAWGTSRHGDIEASVQIMNGKIVDAWISQCWTQYPCSRIAKLPPQVVQRQSENVDAVSGVTQSADAFYYGVMQALIKAKP
jgi:uncharacterized protein with FMN-binding domain